MYRRARSEEWEGGSHGGDRMEGTAAFYAPEQPTVKEAIYILLDFFGKAKPVQFRPGVTPQITPSARLSSD